MPDFKYLDFDLDIERTHTGYRAVVTQSPAGQAAIEFELPFAPLELENYLLKFGGSRRAVRRVDSPEVQAAKQFGGKLFNTVFTGDVRSCLAASLNEAHAHDFGLRIRLHLSATPDLADLPWEFLYNPGLNRFLALSVKTPLVRFIKLPERIRPLAVKPPLHLLVLISTPSDYEPLDVEREWDNLQKGLAPLVDRGLVVIERLPTASLAALQQQLQHKSYHILHFIGHGGFDERAQDGVLVFEDNQRRGRRVSAQHLGTILHDHGTLRLTVLNACEGARTSLGDPFAGVAQSLLQQGVPGVIAMQFEISDDTANIFAASFYQALALGCPVDAALAEVRKTIFANDNEIEWGTPVLYLRAPDGRIFDVQQISADETRRAEFAALLRDASILLAAENLKGASDKAGAAAAMEPNNAELATVMKEIARQEKLAALYTRGKAQLAAQQWRDAVTSFGEVRSIDPEYKDTNSLIQQARRNLDVPQFAPPTISPERGLLSKQPELAAGSQTTPRGKQPTAFGGIPAKYALPLAALIGVLILLVGGWVAFAGLNAQTPTPTLVADAVTPQVTGQATGTAPESTVPAAVTPDGGRTAAAATATAATRLTASANGIKTQTASAERTAVALAGQETVFARQTRTRGADLTGTAIAEQAARVSASQTETAVAEQASAHQTQTAVAERAGASARQTQTAVAGQATTSARQTQTEDARRRIAVAQTQTAAAQQTATSAQQTQTAIARLTAEAKPVPSGRIAFHSKRAGQTKVFVMNADGSDVRQLTSSSGEDRLPAWSPNGARIAFESYRGGNGDIFSIASGGGDERNVTASGDDDGAPTWSPDGGSIAFQSDRAGDYQIFVIGSNGGTPNRLTRSSAWDGPPAWSRANGLIVFESGRDGNAELYVMNGDGSNQRRLTNHGADDLRPGWSPNGGSIVFYSRRDGNGEIYVMDANGGNLRNLTNHSSDDVEPTWSGDGRFIAFASNRDGNYEIYLMDTNGGNVQRITFDGAEDRGPAWSP